MKMHPVNVRSRIEILEPDTLCGNIFGVYIDHIGVYSDDIVSNMCLNNVLLRHYFDYNLLETHLIVSQVSQGSTNPYTPPSINNASWLLYYYSIITVVYYCRKWMIHFYYYWITL